MMMKANTSTEESLVRGSLKMIEGDCSISF